MCILLGGLHFSIEWRVIDDIPTNPGILATLLHERDLSDRI